MPQDRRWRARSAAAGSMERWATITRTGESVARAKTSAALAKQACVCPDPRAVKVHTETAHAVRVKRPFDGLHVSLDAAAAPARRRQQQRGPVMRAALAGKRW